MFIRSSNGTTQVVPSEILKRLIENWCAAPTGLVHLPLLPQHFRAGLTNAALAGWKMTALGHLEIPQVVLTHTLKACATDLE
jgi:hypothetical protein